MNSISTALLALLLAFGIGMVIAPMVIKMCTRLKASQTILSYVTQHKGKQGTGTMGGIIFIVSAVIAGLAFGIFKHETGRMALLITVAYGVIGFLDDFIKVRFKHNKGLKAYQKIIAQLAVALIAAWFAYKSDYVGSRIVIPFAGKSVSLGIWYVPFAAFVFVALTNAVNLTDGIDGLATASTTVFMLFFGIIFAYAVWDSGLSGAVLVEREHASMLSFIAVMLGGLLCFYWFNCNKASIFMGDTGSLALGGAVASVALFSKNPLISILIGITFVVSCISVIIQVISIKLTKRRVFLMSPYHHHLELKGINESKIVGYYSIIGIVAGIVAMIITF